MNGNVFYITSPLEYNRRYLVLNCAYLITEILPIRQVTVKIKASKENPQLHPPASALQDKMSRAKT